MDIMGFVHPRGQLEAIGWMWRENVLGVWSPLAACIRHDTYILMPLNVSRQPPAVTGQCRPSTIKLGVLFFSHRRRRLDNKWGYNFSLVAAPLRPVRCLQLGIFDLK